MEPSALGIPVTELWLMIWDDSTLVLTSPELAHTGQRIRFKNVKAGLFDCARVFALELCFISFSIEV